MNEGLLRDEATACGLTGDRGGADGKLHAIDEYYGILVAEAARARVPLEAARESAREHRAQAEAEVLDTRRRLGERAEAAIDPGMDPFGRVVLRQAPALVFAGLALAGGFALIRDHLDGSFSEPTLVALAVLMAGSFTLFRPVSLLFGRDADADPQAEAASPGMPPPEPWKQYLTELLPPVAASAFAVSWRASDLSVTQVAVSFLFLAVALLFTGRLLLSTLTVVARADEARRIARRTVRRAAQQRDEAAQDVAEAEARVARYAEAEAACEEALAALTDAPEVRALCGYKRALFEAEYAYATASATRYDLRDVPFETPENEASRFTQPSGDGAGYA